MTTDTLDMAVLAKDLTFGSGELGTQSVKLYADGSRPITLDFKASNAEPVERKITLIMQARRNGEELWAIRTLPSCRLLIQPGTARSRESVYGYPSELSLGVSYNPLTGALAVAVGGPVGDPESPRGWITPETFDLHAHNHWASPAGDYEILLGAPETYADQTPLGWTIDCSFRYGPAEHEPCCITYEGGSSCNCGVEPARKSLGEVLAKAAALSESVQDLANERHWEAMLALASANVSSGRFPTGIGATQARSLAADASELLAAHEQWKKDR